MNESRAPVHASILGRTTEEVLGNCARCGGVTTVEIGRSRLAGVAYGVFDRAASDAHAAEARWQELDARATRTRRRRDLRAADAARVRMFAARDAAVTARPTHRHCGGEVVLLRREAKGA